MLGYQVLKNLVVGCYKVQDCVLKHCNQNVHYAQLLICQVKKREGYGGATVQKKLGPQRHLAFLSHGFACFANEKGGLGID